METTRRIAVDRFTLCRVNFSEFSLLFWTPVGGAGWLLGRSDEARGKNKLRSLEKCWLLQSAGARAQSEANRAA